MRIINPKQVVRLLNLTVPEANYGAILRECSSPKEVPQPKFEHFIAAMVSVSLRVLVEDWIKTGTLGDGSESPYKKNVLRTNAAVNVMLQFIRWHPNVAFYLAAKGLSRESDAVEGSAQSHKTLPGCPPTAIKPVYIHSSTDWEDFFWSVTEEAARIFVVLMDNIERNSVCRCRYVACGRYFVNSKPNRVYKQGTFCSRRHQMLASTRSRRAQSFDELIEAAARQLIQWGVAETDWHTPAMKLRLVAALSQLIARKPSLRGYRNEIKSNWISRHAIVIQRRVFTLSTNIVMPEPDPSNGFGLSSIMKTALSRAPDYAKIFRQRTMLFALRSRGSVDEWDDTGDERYTIPDCECTRCEVECDSTADDDWHF
jgi:hypothetical protein